MYKDVKTKLLNLLGKLKHPTYFKPNLENSTNNKDGWKYINELLNRKSQTTIINEINTNEGTVTENQSIVNEN